MKMSTTVRSLLKQWDWALFGLILLYMALPRFYRSYSVYLIGNAIPDTNALVTVAQWQFIELLLEVVQETFVLAIFFFVGRSIQVEEGPGPSIRTTLTSILLFSSVLAAVLFTFSGNFVSVIGTPESVREITSQFLKIKTATIPLSLLSMASVVIVETVNRKCFILIIVVLQVVYQFIFDSLFYGGYPFSFNLGVLGVAWSEIVSGSCLFLTTLILLRRIVFDKVRSLFSFFTLQDWKIYLRVGGWSGLDSLVRNVAYFFMIVKLLNLLGEGSIGGYYLAMHIIWSFFLVPILALAESTRVLIANRSQDRLNVRQIWYSALVIGSIIILIWIVLLPFWGNFASLLNSNREIVDYSQKAMVILIVPYILLALNMVTDSIFYGVGKTKYQAYQAIITNGTVYVVAFLLYLNGIWIPTFTSVLLLFGIGILVDSILTVYYALKVLSGKVETATA